MDLYGIIGWPVKHSLSPAMHNAAFKKLGIDAEYKLFEIEPQEIEYFLDKINKNNIKGLNVTVPYKEKVLEFIKLDQESFFLREIKAVNTLVIENKILKGFNTDIPGFSRHLKVLRFEPRGKKIAILGAGGASRAVSYVLAKQGAREISIFDIDRNKTLGVTEMVKKLFKGFSIKAVDSIEKLDIVSKEALINATPVGLKEDDPCLVSKEMLHEKIFVYDLIYNPTKTKLLSLAKEVGARCSNGLDMLLYQGMLSWSKWTGKNAPEKEMREALLKAISFKL